MVIEHCAISTLIMEHVCHEQSPLIVQAIIIVVVGQCYVDNKIIL